MNKAELEKEFAGQFNKNNMPNKTMPRDVAPLALAALGEVMAAELLGGGEIPLPGVGKLKVKETAARKGRNPKTGESIDIPAGSKVVFTACKELKEAMKS